MPDPRLASAAATLALLLVGCTGHPGPGPIQATNAHAWATTEPVGVTFTDGLEVLVLDGAQDAVIDSVELVGDPELELVGAMVAGRDRGESGAIQIIHTWPPRGRGLNPDSLVPAEGATITPLPGNQGWELFLGIRPTEEGRWVRNGVRVTYTIGERRYSEYLPAGLIVCTDPKYHVARKCPVPRDWPELVRDPAA
jgi:hypothetical protein